MQTAPETMPRITEPHAVQYPDAGVAATRPEIAPEHHPTMDHLRARRKSMMVHEAAANMAVRLVFQHACTALRFAPKALPPLKPSHPNHRKTVPRTMREALCGRKFAIIFSCRRPRTME